MRLWPALVWLALLIAALAGVMDWRSGELRFGVDTRPRALLDAADPDVLALDAANLEFETETRWLLALPTHRLEADRLGPQIVAIHEALARLPAIQQVESLASASLFQADAEGIDTRTVVERLEESPNDVLLNQARENPFLRNRLISSDGQWLGWALTISAQSAGQELSLERSIRDALAPLGHDTAAQITGASLIEAASGTALLDSLQQLMPRLLLVSTLLVLLLARRLYTALFCAAVLCATLAWSGAIIAGQRLDLNLVTALLPPLLVSLSVGYGLYAARSGAGGLGLAALTTGAGFLALALTPVPAVQQFAVLAALGTGFVWLNCQLLLKILPRNAAERRGSDRLQRRVVAMLGHLHRRHRRRILALGALIAVIAGLGIPQLRAGTELAASLPPEDPLRVQFNTLNQAFDGLQGFQILIKGAGEGEMLEPATLHAIDQLDRWLEAQPDISDSESVTDTLKILTASFGEPDQATALPTSADAALQYLWLGAGGSVRHLINQDYSQVNLHVRTHLADTAALSALRDRVDARLQRLPPELDARITGDTIVLADTINTIAEGQLPSIAAALLAIYIGLAVMFTSASAGALALIPNVLPILMYFGALGYGGISLSPATSLVACIVIGLAVDNTIHYFTSFNRYAHATGSESQATRLALANVLGPATTTTAILCAGFAMLALDPLPEQARFGLLAAATLACAWLNDLLLTPALASGLRVVTLWDLLRLDLGEAPERELPLMHGLTTRQAKILALMLDSRELGAGEPLMREGETGDEFFLLIDGQMQASVVRDEETRVLGTVERGALIGEAGFLGQARTASVTALTDCRLLRTDADALERLRRRYPRIAAIVYRNLHRSLAQRFAANIQLIR